LIDGSFLIIILKFSCIIESKLNEGTFVFKLGVDKDLRFSC